MLVDVSYEALTTFCLLIAGLALVVSIPLHDALHKSVVWAWSTAYGISATVATFSVTSLAGINRPWIIFLPPVLATSVAIKRRGATAAAHRIVREVPSVLVLSLMLTLIARTLRLGSYTGDSFQLIASARALAQNRRAGPAIASPFNFEEFPPGYSILQIPAAWGGHTANHGLGLALALALIALLGHALRAAQRPTPHIAVGAILAVLMSSHFFWVMTTYINSHAVVALLLLGTYLRLTSTQGRIRDELPTLLMVASLVVLRVENLLLVALFLMSRVGTGASREIGRLRTIRALLAAAGATGLAHQGTVLFFYQASGQSPSRSALGLFLLAFGLILVALIAPLLAGLRLVPIRGEVWVLLGFNVVYALHETAGFIASSVATAQNLLGWKGGWGILPPLVIALTLAVLLFMRDPEGSGEPQALITFLLAAFLLLFFTGYLREKPFRVGVGDSMNRQLFHLLPLALLAIGRAIGQGSLDRYRKMRL